MDIVNLKSVSAYPDILRWVSLAMLAVLRALGAGPGSWYGNLIKYEKM